MAHTYKPVDRDQLFLLPPNMKDWLPEDHLVWFVIDVVNRVDTSELHKRHANNGVGRRAYNPEMMLALLIYSYCVGSRSSRELEKLCWSDVAYRILSAGEKPDHSTIARFRVDFAHLTQKFFVDVLELAREAGAGSVGVIALDGTKMAADASKKFNRTRESLEAEVAELMAEAIRVDAEEDKQFGDRRGDELPPDLASSAKRKAALEKAAASLAERDNKTPTERQVRDKDERIEVSRRREFRSLQRLRREMAKQRATRNRQEAKSGKPIGRPRINPEASTRVERARSDFKANKARRKEFEKRSGLDPNTNNKTNITDPDSRIMQSAQGSWVQGFNAQSAVNEDGIIVGAFVSNAPNDLNQFIPMLTNIEENLSAAGITESIGTVVADAGYISDDNLNAAGPNRLIATGKSHKMKRQELTDDPVPKDATPKERNEHLLRTNEGRATYSKRQHMIEPVFGHTKANRGYRSFMQRGLDRVNAEWLLIMTAHNIEKLYSRAK